MGFTIGPMADAMKDTGKTGNSTVKENISCRMELLRLGYGKMGRGSDGLIKLTLAVPHPCMRIMIDHLEKSIYYLSTYMYNMNVLKNHY
jgi:hypothetical protein